MAGFSPAFRNALAKILNVKSNSKNNHSSNNKSIMSTNQLKFETLQVHVAR